MTEKAATVTCGVALTISHASELYQDLRKALDKGLNVVIVADEVEKVDTAGLQVLIALAKEIEKIGGTMTWKSPSEAVTKAALTLGLNEYLALN